MNKTSLLAIFLIIVFSVFYTIPKIIFLSKPSETKIIQTQTINIPSVDSFDENIYIQNILDKYNFSEKQLNFYREYTDGIVAHRFDVNAKGEKDDIFNFADEVSVLKNVIVRNISIQKLSDDIYSIRIEFSFIGVE